MSVIAIVSQKGGSGKTTLALHLATCAAYAKQTTCVVDTDPQATAAAWGDWRGDFLPIGRSRGWPSEELLRALF